MQVSQIYNLLNTVTTELLGESVIVAEDLSNVVEIGQAIDNIKGFDNYVYSLTDHIGRIIFDDRPYTGRAPSVLMDGWEYGSIKEKVDMELPNATENESWELQDGASYDPNIFYKPKVSALFWDKKTTFEIPISVTEMQVKSSFSDVTQLNAFMSMIYTKIENALTLRNDALIMRTINNMIAETIHADYPSGTYTDSSGVKAVNLLYLYNHRPNAGDALTAEQAIYTPDFIRFAAFKMGLYADRMSTYSTLFNVGKTAKFTPRDRMKIVMLSEFKNAANVYLQSEVFHNEFTRLPDADPVTYWQGSGTDYSFNSASAINVKTSSNNDVNVTGVLGAMFDRDALGVTNFNRRTTSHWNPKAEFWNQWHKVDAGYFNDLNENMIVFFVA